MRQGRDVSKRLELVFENPEELVGLVHGRLSLLGWTERDIADNLGMTSGTWKRYATEARGDLKLDVFLTLLDCAGLRMRIETKRPVKCREGLVDEDEVGQGFKRSDLTPHPVDRIRDRSPFHKG